MNWYVCKFKKSELKYPHLGDEYYISSRRNGTIRGDDTDAPIYLCRTQDIDRVPYISNLVDDNGRYQSEDEAEAAIEAWKESLPKAIDKSECSV